MPLLLKIKKILQIYDIQMTELKDNLETLHKLITMLYIQANGAYQLIVRMALVFRYGLMDLNIQVLGKMEKLMDMENYYMLMGIYMKDNGRMTKLKDMVLIYILKAQNIKANGKMINKMEQANNSGQIIRYIKVNM